MYRDNERQRLFTRRAAVLGGVQLAGAALLAGRMYQIQVVESDRYKMLAEDNRINMRLVAPARGRILDRFSSPLAVNRESYRVLLIAEQTRDVDRTLDMLDRVIGLTEAERARVLREVKRRRGFVPVTVREGLDWREVAKIEVNAPDLPGIAIDADLVRDYPHSMKSVHVLGYVAAVSEAEFGDDPLLQLPGFRIGKAGIEKTRDLALRGKAGASQVEVNALGRVIREVGRVEGEPGNDVHLTLDIALQAFAQDRLAGHQSASAVLVGVETGEVLAMASTPGYEPNQFVMGLRADTWRSVVSDPMTPLLNRCLSGLYAPGSTFKLAVTLAALNARRTWPDRRVFCKGFMELGQTQFHCWKKHGHGWLDLVGAIEQSCDIYFYELAQQVGIDRIAETARELGLGGKLLDDLPGEEEGLIPTPEWKLASIGTRWQGGETLITGIGQGFVLTTPLQLAVMTARIASGRAVVPRLVIENGIGAAPPPEPRFPPLDIRKSALNTVRLGMDAVANNKRGTAYRYAIRDPALALAGKTGTSQVVKISKSERGTRLLKNHERPWHERDHALFVAYAPIDKPRYAISVVVEHGGAGSSVAAPIARDILLEAQRRDPLGANAGDRLAWVETLPGQG